MYFIPTVPPKIFNERLDTCKACKFFKPQTGSCGTLILGDTVTHYRNKIKLCGCVMKWKAKYRLSSCPAGKWQPVNVSTDEIKSIEKFIRSIENKASITHDENKQLFEYFNKITGYREKVTTCAPCVKSVLEDMKKEINRLNMVQE